MDTRQDLDCWRVFDGCARLLLRFDGFVLHRCTFARELIDGRIGLSLERRKLYLKGMLVSEPFLRRRIGRDGIGLLHRDARHTLLASSKVCRLDGQPVIALMLRDIQSDERPDFACLREAFSLTCAEEGVARQLLGGLTPAQIAAAEGLSINTVRSHIAHLYAKLDASNREEMWMKCAPYMVKRVNRAFSVTNVNDEESNNPAYKFGYTNTQMN